MAKVLIVDDAEFLRVRLNKMLDTDGHEVFQAENGIKAVATYKEIHPDVVLMDIDLPGDSGIKGVLKIKEAKPETAIIMYTVFEDDEKILKAKISSPSSKNRA